MLETIEITVGFIIQKSAAGRIPYGLRQASKSGKAGRIHAPPGARGSLASFLLTAFVRSGNIPDENNVFQKFRHKPDVWDMRQALKSRAVSVASDEALCLFCNMNMEMELITSVPRKKEWRNSGAR